MDDKKPIDTVPWVISVAELRAALEVLPSVADVWVMVDGQPREDGNRYVVLEAADVPLVRTLLNTEKRNTQPAFDRAKIQAEAESQGRVLVEKVEVEKGFWIERDRRPKRGFWAPGFYDNTCTGCHQIFVGDKRAKMCAPCEYGDDFDDDNAKTADPEKLGSSLVDEACRAEELFGVDECERFHEESTRRDVQTPDDENVFCDPPPSEQDDE